jgi:Protein of unknown function (DUF1570)
MDQSQMRDLPAAPAAITRRTWLTLTAGIAGSFATMSVRSAQAPLGDDDAAAERAVFDQAKRVEMKPLHTTRSTHFLGIGDAPEGFRSLTLRDCESLAADYIDHYREKGFNLALPSGRMTVVILADDRSFAAFAGNKSLRLIPRRADVAPTVHGYYDRTANRLVVFDHRPLGPQLAPRAAHENLRAVAHEGTHLLAFNTGLLEPRRDVPLAVVEGLAMYGEVRSSNARTAPGQLNRMRLTDLASVQRRKIPWIPVEQLLIDDGLFSQSGTFQGLLAYAESWLLVDYLMKDATRAANFREYLKSVGTRVNAATRVDDARAQLGDLEVLNKELQGYSRRLLQGM